MSRRDTYTHGHASSVLRSHKLRTAENSAAYLLPHLQAGMELLDVGCGPGNITIGLAGYVAPGRVVGVDNVAAAITEALAARPEDASIEFRVDDAYALDVADDSFDVVHAHQVLQHLSDPVGALREWRRACRPGGVVAARDADYEAFTWFPHDPLLDRWLELYRSAARANDAEPDAGRRLLAWAHAAGFTDVTGSASVWCYSTPEEVATWGNGWADRILTSALAGQLLADGIEQSELDAISQAWRRWAAHPDAWFLIPHGEILATA